MANDIEDQDFKYLEGLIKEMGEKRTRAIQEVKDQITRAMDEFRDQNKKAMKEIRLRISGITHQAKEVSSQSHLQVANRNDGILDPSGSSITASHCTKLECPRFDGCDLHECLYKMEQPLGLDHIVELNKVKVASRPLDDKIPQWFKGPVSSKDLIPINGRPVSDCNSGGIYTMYQEAQKFLQPSLMKSVDAPQLFEEIPQWESVPWNAKIGTEFESMEKVNHVSLSVGTQILVLNSSISGWKQELYPDVMPWRPDSLTISLIEGNNGDDVVVLLLTSTTHNGQLQKVLTAIGEFYNCSIAIEMILDVIITPPVVEYTSSLVLWLLEVVEEDERDPSYACTCSNRVVPGILLTFNHTFEGMEWNSEIVLSSNSMMTCLLKELLELVTRIISFTFWAVSADALSIPYDMDTIKNSADVVRSAEQIVMVGGWLVIEEGFSLAVVFMERLRCFKVGCSQSSSSAGKGKRYQGSNRITYGFRLVKRKANHSMEAYNAFRAIESTDWASIVAALMDIITSNYDHSSSFQPLLSQKADMRDIATTIQVIEEGDPSRSATLVEGSFVPKNNLEETILLLMILLRKSLLDKTQWNSSVTELLNFALSICDQTFLLGRQFEELPLGTYPHFDKWSNMAPCHTGAVQNKAELNLLRESLSKHESPDNIITPLSEILEAVTQLLKQPLSRAQHRMETQTSKHHSERSFEVGDMVCLILKLQPYLQNLMVAREVPKIAANYYDPYEITDKIGKAAYKLDLSPSLLQFTPHSMYPYSRRL